MRIGIRDLFPRQTMRILLTETCNAQCASCMNAGFRSPIEMDFRDFEAVCKYLSSNGIGELTIMGGEPTVYSRFEEAVALAQRYFNEVGIFTNALNDRIKNINPRHGDAVVYNFGFIGDGFDCGNLLPDAPGRRFLEVLVTSDIDAASVIKRLTKLYTEVEGSRKKVGIRLTLNCIENIFKYKEQIIVRWNQIAGFIRNELRLGFQVDHYIPQCFYADSAMILNRNTGSMCQTEYAGLIDARLNLRHCDLYSDILLNIKKGDRFMPFTVLMGQIYRANRQKSLQNWRKVCGECVRFNAGCNGGCFIHNKDIAREDVLPVARLFRGEMAAL